MNYTEAKAKRDCIDGHVRRLGKIVKQFPRLENGLTPDHIKFSPKYRFAMGQFNLAFNDLRAFNQWFVKTFKTELRNERRAP